MEPRAKGSGYRVKSLTPKTRLALKMLILGNCNTQEAAAIANVHPTYLSNVRGSVPAMQYEQELEGRLDEKAIETHALLQKLGREAVERIAGLMRFSANENIVFRSSQDLADRAPDTQKIHKHQVESFTLSGKDASALAEAMVASAKLKSQFIQAAQGDFIKIPDAGSDLRPDE